MPTVILLIAIIAALKRCRERAGLQSPEYRVEMLVFIIGLPLVAAAAGFG